jgi:hypothetical protein
MMSQISERQETIIKPQNIEAYGTVSRKLFPADRRLTVEGISSRSCQGIVKCLSFSRRVPSTPG